jgi:transposase-like protein
MFAAEIRRKRVQQMRAYSNWRWLLDEVFVKINGEMHYLWRAMDHEGEVLESYVTKRRNRKAALKFLRKKNEASRSPSYPGDRQTPVLRRGNEGHRQRWPTGNRPLEKQQS